MLEIKKKYIVDENDQKVAVQLDIETFRRIAQILEDYALGELIKENKPEDNVSIEEAKAYYKNLKKVK
ncbi:MAG: hypothetical protein ICV83_04475 [Cytophagales bacterium]|nr:hypothetical protein [Cytophagales bacterium]